VRVPHNPSLSRFPKVDELGRRNNITRLFPPQTVQNKERVLFGERELVRCFPPFIAESEQAVIEGKFVKVLCFGD
jgi:hypothetical protein